MSAPAALDALAPRALDDLALFPYPEKDWVAPRTGPNGEPVANVVIVGGGQNGLAIAFGLQRERVAGVTVIDENPAGQEGPWVTFARMITLRTLKFLTGPDLGFPNLTFRRWHEAQYGEDSWDRLVRIHKDEWMRYLVWFRRTLDIPVRNNVRLLRVEPVGDLLALHLDPPEVMLTRKLVLATGMEGAGRRRIPDFVRDRLPPDRWAHTSDAIDFARLRDQRVVVMGAGASAFDNAATALEAGASRVDIFIRRPSLSMVNGFRTLESAGFWRNFGDMDDASRWRFMRHYLTLPMPPPQDTLDRTFANRNAHARYGAPIGDAAMGPGGVRLKTPKGWHVADFLILGTGFGADLTLRPELADIAPNIATWADRYQPPPDEEDPVAGGHPYLGPGYELTEKRPGTMPVLRNIHLFNGGAVVSMGPSIGGLNAMPYAIPRLLAHLSRDLFRADLDTLYEAFRHYDEPDAWEKVRATGT